MVRHILVIEEKVLLKLAAQELLKIKASVEPCLVRVVVLMRGCSRMGEYKGGKEKITVYSLQKTRPHHWFKRCSLGTKGPKVCQENIPHTITPPPPAWTIKTSQDGSMLSCSLRQTMTLPSECCSRNRDSSDQATVFPIFYCPILVNLCELSPLFPVLSWQERHPVWSSAAVADLLQGSTVLEMVFCIPWL